MRMLDLDREQGVRVLQLYLSPAEAAGLHQALGELLVDAERNDRRHVFVAHMSRELSGSIVTPKPVP